MSRETWRLVRQTKQFYVNTLRRAETVLLFSILLNLILGMWGYHLYFNQPARHYYATNGVTSPEELTAMAAPNNTSMPLLAADPENEVTAKAVPE